MTCDLLDRSNSQLHTRLSWLLIPNAYCFPYSLSSFWLEHDVASPKGRNRHDVWGEHLRSGFSDILICMIQINSLKNTQKKRCMEFMTAHLSTCKQRCCQKGKQSKPGIESNKKRRWCPVCHHLSLTLKGITSNFQLKKLSKDCAAWIKVKP